MEREEEEWKKREWETERRERELDEMERRWKKEAESLAPVHWPEKEACWSCGKSGHRYSECLQPRGDRVFCYGCRNLGVILSGCTQCKYEYDH